MAAQVLEHNLRIASIARGRRLEYVTIVWNSLEGIIAVGAGLVSGSVALVDFGVDSVKEGVDALRGETCDDCH